MYMIVGAAGFLGSYLVDELSRATDERIVAVYHRQKGIQQGGRIAWVRCDITDAGDVGALNREFQSEDKKVVFLTACHNPDIVFENPRLAWDINIVALADFVNRMDNVRGFIYPSTDSVYGNSIDGHRYIEPSRLNPVNVYGKQKVLAEQVVTGYGYHVVRLPFMVGHSLAAGKEHFYDRIADALISGREVEMFADSYRSTLSFRQAARFVIRAFDFIGTELRFPQIMNICSDEGMSKFEMGKLVAKRLGVREGLVRPIYLAENRTVFRTPRADSTVMDNTLMKKWYGMESVLFDVDSC